MRKSAHPGTSAWDFSTSNFKTSILPLAQLSTLGLAVGFITAEIDSQNIRFQRHLLRRERRDDAGLYAPAVPDLHINLL